MDRVPSYRVRLFECLFVMFLAVGYTSLSMVTASVEVPTAVKKLCGTNKNCVPEAYPELWGLITRSALLMGPVYAALVLCLVRVGVFHHMKQKNLFRDNWIHWFSIFTAISFPLCVFAAFGALVPFMPAGAVQPAQTARVFVASLQIVALAVTAALPRFYGLAVETDWD